MFIYYVCLFGKLFRESLEFSFSLQLLSQSVMAISRVRSFIPFSNGIRNSVSSIYRFYSSTHFEVSVFSSSLLSSVFWEWGRSCSILAVEDMTCDRDFLLADSQSDMWYNGWPSFNVFTVSMRINDRLVLSDCQDIVSLYCLVAKKVGFQVVVPDLVMGFWERGTAIAPVNFPR